MCDEQLGVNSLKIFVDLKLSKFLNILKKKNKFQNANSFQLSF